MSIKSSSLINKLIFIVTLVVLFTWLIPKVFDYFKDIKKYELVDNKIKDSYNRYNLVDIAEKFNVEKFKKEIDSSFFNSIIKDKSNGEYLITIQIDKTKIDDFNNFIKTISLHYLVEIKDGQLNFKDKNQQLIEVKFSLREL